MSCLCGPIITLHLDPYVAGQSQPWSNFGQHFDLVNILTNSVLNRAFCRECLILVTCAYLEPFMNITNATYSCHTLIHNAYSSCMKLGHLQTFNAVHRMRETSVFSLTFT